MITINFCNKLALKRKMDLDYISEVISNNGEPDIKCLKESIQNVLEKINTLKGKAKEEMEEKYVKFATIVSDNDEILKAASDLECDVKQLVSHLDTEIKRDVEDLTEELKALKESLIESTVTVEVVSKLCKIDRDFKEAKERGKSKNYYSTAKYINEVVSYVTEECKDLDFLDIYQSLSESVAYLKDEYCKESVVQWRSHISWSQIDSDLTSKISHTSLCILADKNCLENLIKTLELYDVSDMEIAAFSDNLLKKLLIPAITKDSTVTVKTRGLSELPDELNMFWSSDPATPSYERVLENLSNIFEFLNKFLSISMNETTFISAVGKFISDEFINILIDDCLTNAIPVKRELLKTYTTVVESATAFQALLISMGFLSESNKVLEDYFGKVETHFLNKTIEKYLDAARTLYKKDLHELIEVGDSPSFGKDRKEVTIKKEEQAVSSVSKNVNLDTLLMDVDELCPNLFKFPKCAVSTSVQELIKLINEILNESTESDDKSSLQLFRLARDIISLYPDTVAMYHSKLLHDIPQYSALLYNNLMYLVHFIVTVDYDKKSQSASSGNIPQISCFADLILPLRKEAFQVLSSQIQRQKKILLNLIKESGLTALSEHEELPETTEKNIRACIRQLSLLKAVWEKVLPSSIYAMVIGELCTVIIHDITNCIVATTDISEDIATSLVKVLSHIQTEAPRLFAEPSDIYFHVKNWSKLRELVLVLGASLAEVAERWADAKGPLAVEFTPDQVRKMVKALFQVSDRRAAVLSKIK